jgi:hypothetical protein
VRLGGTLPGCCWLCWQPRQRRPGLLLKAGGAAGAGAAAVVPGRGARKTGKCKTDRCSCSRAAVAAGSLRYDRCCEVAGKVGVSLLCALLCAQPGRHICLLFMPCLSQRLNQAVNTQVLKVPMHPAAWLRWTVCLLNHCCISPIDTPAGQVPHAQLARV